MLPERAWQELSIDFMGPLPWGKSLLVVIDNFSRFYEVAVVEGTTSKEMIKELRTVFARWGIPDRMLSGNGRQFTSEEFGMFCEELGIDLRHSTPYWPRVNGEVETQNRSLKKILQISYLNKTDWVRDLLDRLMMQRNTPHTVTGTVPSELMKTRAMRDKIPSAIELMTS